MSKRFWIIIAVIAVLFIGILYVSGRNKNSGSSAAGTSNHVKGKLDSKVTFVEYGDFQCPVCGAYYPVVSQVMAKYQDRVKFQFRNLPLSEVHPNAFAAARAAEAAAQQGKFWEMYDQLFRNQTTWSQSSSPNAYFRQYAGVIGLDGKKFDTAFSSDAVNKTINADIGAFKKTGLQDRKRPATARGSFALILDKLLPSGLMDSHWHVCWPRTDNFNLDGHNTSQVGPCEQACRVFVCF